MSGAGYNDNAMTEQAWSGLTPLANQRGVIAVYPAGMDDCGGDECYSSWAGAGQG